MCGKPGYSTENTPSKKTSLRWGDDCPNISLAETNLSTARSLSSSSSIVAKSVVISFKGKNRNIIFISRIMLGIIYKYSIIFKMIRIIGFIGFYFSYWWIYYLRKQTREPPQWSRYLCYSWSNNHKNILQRNFLHIIFCGKWMIATSFNKNIFLIFLLLH